MKLKISKNQPKDKSIIGNGIRQKKSLLTDTIQTKHQEMANESSKVHQLQAFQKLADQSIQRKSNNTNLPTQLKSGIENLSGISMDDVKVHYNSSKPAQLQAHAYAQGTNIHLGPGQEKHLPHEAWHVVQQKQGRVKPTMQMKGKVNINNDAGLEREADVMGEKATQFKAIQFKQRNSPKKSAVQNNIQAKFSDQAVLIQLFRDEAHQIQSINVFNSFLPNYSSAINWLQNARLTNRDRRVVIEGSRMKPGLKPKYLNMFPLPVAPIAPVVPVAPPPPLPVVVAPPVVVPATPVGQIQHTFNIPAAALPAIHAAPAAQAHLATELVRNAVIFRPFLNNSVANFNLLLASVRRGNLNLRVQALTRIDRLLLPANRVIELPTICNAIDPTGVHLEGALRGAAPVAALNRLIHLIDFPTLAARLAPLPTGEWTTALSALANIANVNIDQAREIGVGRMPLLIEADNLHGPGTGAPGGLNFNPAELPGHFRKHVMGLDGNPGLDEPNMWRQRLHMHLHPGMAGLGNLTVLERALAFGNTNQVDTLHKSRFFFETLVASRPGLLAALVAAYQVPYANYVSARLGAAGNAFMLYHAGQFAIVGSNNGTFIFARLIGGVFLIQSGYIPENLGGAIARNAVEKIWDL